MLQQVFYWMDALLVAQTTVSKNIRKYNIATIFQSAVRLRTLLYI